MGKGLGHEFETQDQLGHARGLRIDRASAQETSAPPPEAGQTEEDFITPVPPALAAAHAAIRNQFDAHLAPTAPQSLEAVVIPLTARDAQANALDETTLSPRTVADSIMAPLIQAHEELGPGVAREINDSALGKVAHAAVNQTPSHNRL